jgi:hypothetical protein
MRRANVWRVATVLIKQFGGDAGKIAAACASALEEMGDSELAVLWIRVGRSIAELERAAPHSNGRMN